MTHQQTFFGKILTSATLAVALAPFAAADIEKFLPATETLSFVKIENISSLEKKAKTDALVAEIRTRIFSKIKEQAAKEAPKDTENVGTWLEELSEDFAGEAVVACSCFDNEFSFVFIADCAKGLDVEETTLTLLEGPEDGAKPKISTIQVAGVPVKVFKGNPKFYATKVDKKYILSTDKKAISAVISAVKLGKSKKPSGIFASASFKNARERMGKADVWFYFDGKTAADLAYDFARDADKKTEEEMQTHDSTELSLDAMISKTQLVRAIAPEALNSVWGYWTLDAAENYPSEFSLSWNEKRGLIGAFFGEAFKNGFEKLPVFPAREDFVSVSTVNYSIGTAILNLLNIARTATPMFSMGADFMAQNLKASEGIDVYAWLGAIKHGASNYTWGKKEISVFTVSSDEFAVNSARAIAAGESRMITESALPDGTPMFTMTNAKVSFVARNGKLYIGETTALIEFASFALSKTPTVSIWDDAKFKEAEAILPAGGAGISYMHLGKSIKEGLETIVEESKSDDVSRFFVPILSSFGVDAFDYTSISKVYLGENEVTMRGYLIKNAK